MDATSLKAGKRPENVPEALPFLRRLRRSDATLDLSVWLEYIMDTIELHANYSSGNSPIEITVDTPKIMGLGSLYAPTLLIPVAYRCNQLRRDDQDGPMDYILPEIHGCLAVRGEDRLAELRGEPSFMIKSRDHYRPSYTQVYVPLDSKRIELMERHRSGGDMELQLQVWGTAFIDKPGNILIDRFHSNGPLELKVPQSTWVGNVLNKWKFAQTHLIEIQTGVSKMETLAPKAIEHLRAAEDHFLQHNPRETMASLYSAFEALALQRGRTSPDKDFFADLLSSLPSDMCAKYRDLFRQYCIMLHLGRHESGQENAQQIPLQQKDAQLALIVGQTILSYISGLD